jgi:hypothetical protein
MANSQHGHHLQYFSQSRLTRLVILHFNSYLRIPYKFVMKAHVQEGISRPTSKLRVFIYTSHTYCISRTEKQTAATQIFPSPSPSLPVHCLPWNDARVLQVWSQAAEPAERAPVSQAICSTNWTLFPNIVHYFWPKPWSKVVHFIRK